MVHEAFDAEEGGVGTRVLHYDNLNGGRNADPHSHPRLPGSGAATDAPRPRKLRMRSSLALRLLDRHQASLSAMVNV